MYYFEQINKIQTDMIQIYRKTDGNYYEEYMHRDFFFIKYLMRRYSKK